MPKCTYCGADIPDGERYCPVCRAAIPPKYEGKNGDYSGTYGHDDCWEVDESRYRRSDYAQRNFDSSSLHEWKPSRSDSSPASKPAPAKKHPAESKTLRNISLLIVILTWIVNPGGYLPLILVIVGAIIDHRGGNAKPLYITSLVLSLFFIIILMYLMFTGSLTDVLGALMPY